MNNLDKLKKNLLHLSEQKMIPENHIKYLYKLKSEGFEPKIIYDIGSCVLHWTKIAQDLWPNAKIILFEAQESIEFLYKDYDFFIGVLSNKDFKIVNFYQNDKHPGGNSYYKEIGHNLSSKLYNENNCYKKITYKLDTIIKKRNLPLPDLVKIDVQGAEKDIIEGGINTIQNCKYLIVECQKMEYNLGAPQYKETIPYIESLNFQYLGEICSNGYADSDFAFINKNI